MSKIQYVVISGSSQGLGKCFAKVCAARGMNLILTALPDEGIYDLANEMINIYGIDALAYEADLTNEKELSDFCDWINSKYEINMLINNAGVGGERSFRDAPYNYISNMLLLNINSLVMLTYKLLPNLERQESSYILNIASMASFGPIPYKTVYPASKAFVYSFSRGLFSELKDTGVFVSVVHPGGMLTNDEVSGRINEQNKLVKSTILSPEQIAEISIKKLLKKKAVIIPGFMNKLSWLLFRILPVPLCLKIFRRVLNKEINTKE